MRPEREPPPLLRDLSPKAASKLCLCGKPLHYTDPVIQEKVQALVEELGDCMKVSAGGRAWMVPRHYVALHGLRAAELPFLGLQEVEP
jgi:hypothetical protein